MLLRAKNTINGLKEDGAGIAAGETFTCSLEEAERLIELDAAEEVDEEEHEEPFDNKAATMTRIAQAQTLEQLGALSADETDQEIIDAYNKRRDEIDDPDH